MQTLPKNLNKVVAWWEHYPVMRQCFGIFLDSSEVFLPDDHFWLRHIEEFRVKNGVKLSECDSLYGQILTLDTVKNLKNEANDVTYKIIGEIVDGKIKLNEKLPKKQFEDTRTWAARKAKLTKKSRKKLP